MAFIELHPAVKQAYLKQAGDNPHYQDAVNSWPDSHHISWGALRWAVRVGLYERESSPEITHKFLQITAHRCWEKRGKPEGDPDSDWAEALSQVGDCKVVRWLPATNFPIVYELENPKVIDGKTYEAGTRLLVKSSPDSAIESSGHPFFHYKDYSYSVDNGQTWHKTGRASWLRGIHDFTDASLDFEWEVEVAPVNYNWCVTQVLGMAVKKASEDISTAEDQRLFGEDTLLVNTGKSWVLK